MLKELKNNLRVELAQSADIQFVHEILKRNFPQDLLRFTFYQYNSYIEYLKKLLNKDLIIILKSNNEICGFAHFLNYEKDTLFLNNIYIERKYRGLNGGGLLIKEGEKWGKSIGLSKFELDVFEFNTNAISFYQKNEFVKKNIINWYVFTPDYKPYVFSKMKEGTKASFVKIISNDKIEEIPIFNNFFYRIKNINLLKNRELMQMVEKSKAYFLYIGKERISGINPIVKSIRMNKILHL
ncbi:MAG: hypothetical protein DRJ01_05295 [Bacteroidetes bacterium]|nr:MAG: hypothetical protein DRJ01_05295 [Bacteroidota bacterium]